MSSAPRILLMAGGTGGHIFPALAVASYLAEKGWSTHWLGSETGMEVDLVPKHNIELSLIHVKGVRGKGFISRLQSSLIILRAVWQAMKVLRQYKPNVVLGMGGFASGPGGVAAWLLRVPLCIHEQNAIAGVTNQLLSKIALYRLQAFPGALNGADAVTGNPVRSNIYQLADPQLRFETRDDPLRLLIVGGSRGAAIFNQLMPEVIAKVRREKKIQVWHQTGANSKVIVQQRYQSVDCDNESLRITEFIEDMDAAYQWADLIVCRSGALTVSEIAAVGLAAIFVPFPHAVDDHQTANAKYLSDAGAAVIIQQSTMNSDLLASEILKLGRRESCLLMAKAAQIKSKPNATQDVAEFCIRAAKLDSVRYAA